MVSPFSGAKVSRLTSRLLSTTFALFSSDTNTQSTCGLLCTAPGRRRVKGKPLEHEAPAVCSVVSNLLLVSMRLKQALLLACKQGAISNLSQFLMIKISMVVLFLKNIKTTISIFFFFFLASTLRDLVLSQHLLSSSFQPCTSAHGSGSRTSEKTQAPPCSSSSELPDLGTR